MSLSTAGLCLRDNDECLETGVQPLNELRSSRRDFTRIVTDESSGQSGRRADRFAEDLPVEL